MKVDSMQPRYEVRCKGKGCPWRAPEPAMLNNSGSAKHHARQHVEHTHHEVEIVETTVWCMVPTTDEEMMRM